MMEQTFARANKITSYWEGEGVAVAVFYKTHDKVASIKSSEVADFKMPEGDDVTASQKLDAFKAHMITNASAFGILYDPVDRRADEFKFPSRYTEENIIEYAKKMMDMTVTKVLKSLQTNVIDKMVKSGLLPEKSEIQYGFGQPELVVTEKYSSGSLKYATVKYPIAFAVNGVQHDTIVDIDLVSGQIKKPRNIGDTVLTMSGVKTMLVDAGVLPKKAEKSEDAADDAAATTEEAK